MQINSYRLLVLTLVAFSFLHFAALAPANADDLDNIFFEGTIRDSSGAVIPAAKVVALQTATGIERIAISNAEGRFRIEFGAPGIYRLKASATGFSAEDSQQVTAATGRTFTIEFTLTAVGVTEQITVAASGAPLIDTNRTVVGDTVTQLELEDLPIINRDPLQLVFLLGGVAEAPLSTAELADEG